MKLEVLLSCMHQKDDAIIKESNLSDVPTLVINQCDIEDDCIVQVDEFHRIYNTKSRGLSVSRNLGISNSDGDICLISDDDEIFINRLESTVSEAYHRFPKADIIVFKVKNLNKRLGSKCKRLTRWNLLRVASPQITFRRSSVVGIVQFDANLGAGTPNGGGEETKFLLDCHKSKRKIYFVPVEIAELRVGSASTWFSEFNETYFYNLGASLRYILGNFVSYLYIIYTIISKRRRFTQNISFKNMRRAIWKGWRENKLGAKN